MSDEMTKTTPAERVRAALFDEFAEAVERCCRLGSRESRARVIDAYITGPDDGAA